MAPDDDECQIDFDKIQANHAFQNIVLLNHTVTNWLRLSFRCLHSTEYKAYLNKIIIS